MSELIIKQKGVDWIVSDNGLICSPEREVVVSRKTKEKECVYKKILKKTTLSPWVSNTGYYVVSQKYGNKRIKMFVHRLIALAFVDGYKDGFTVNHINGNKLDNRPENLEWVSLSDNSKHQWETGLVNLKGENQPLHKLTQKQVIDIRKALRLGVAVKALANMTNVSVSTIYLIKQNKRWVDVC
jgi:hypothetical protein